MVDINNIATVWTWIWFPWLDKKSVDRDIKHVSSRLEMLFWDFQESTSLNLRYATVINLDFQC